jgi:hypothetical protein
MTAREMYLSEQAGALVFFVPRTRGAGSRLPNPSLLSAVVEVVVRLGTKGNFISPGGPSPVPLCWWKELNTEVHPRRRHAVVHKSKRILGRMLQCRLQ